MIKFLIYLFESSVILALFYLLYMLLIKKETFFNFNRFFLIGILVFSLLLPLLSFNVSQGNIAFVDNSIEEFSKFRMSYYERIETTDTKTIPLNNATVTPTIEVNPIDWIAVLVKFVFGIYIIGIILCLSKLFWTFRRLRKMILKHPHTHVQGINVVRIPQVMAPFSFLQYAFVHEGIQDSKEFEQIVAHEKIHIKQKHSIDLIFVQFLAAFLWFNPLIWRLIKSLKTTHEYIADAHIIKTGYSLVDYQILLLRQLVSNDSLGLVHNFNLSFIKKRITMMKSNKSGFVGKLKVTLVITCTILFSLVSIQCNSKVDIKHTTKQQAVLDLYEKHRKLGKPTTIFKEFPTFSIKDDKLFVDGKPCTISDVESILDKAAIGRHGLVRLRVDGQQKMKKIREFQTELRRLDRRKIVYYGQTASGKQMIQPFLTPPFHWADPSRDDSLYPTFDLTNAIITGNVATLDGIEYLNLDLSSTGVNYREEVYTFVKKHVDKKSIAYLISTTYNDDDVFENYLTNLAEVFQGFEKLYNVRAKELFDKDRKNLERTEMLKMSEGVYKAVFIAEK